MKKILLAEDEQYIRELYKNILEDAGFLVDEADNGEDALKKALTIDYDLIFLDVMMPKKDGLSVLKELKKIKESNPRKKIIMLTVLASDEFIKLALSFGADGYLIKTSLTPGQVVEKAREYLMEHF